MNKVVISADSTSDLSKELIERYNIHIIPLSVILGDEIHTDGVDICQQDLFDYVSRSGCLPKTSAVTVGEYSDFFNKMKAEGFDVVHICISSLFSSCYQSAMIAAEEAGNAYIVDSYNLSTGTGHLAIEAAIKAEEGMCASDIAEYLKSLVPNVDASFVIDAIPYLYKGGRCSAVAALGANLLKLKPGIIIKDGKMDVGKKYRGNMKDVVRTYAIDRLNLPGVKYKRDRVFVTSTCVHKELIDIVVDEVKKSGLFDEILITYAGATVSSHCGPDTIGVLFIHE